MIVLRQVGTSVPPIRSTDHWSPVIGFLCHSTAHHYQTAPSLIAIKCFLTPSSAVLCQTLGSSSRPCPNQPKLSTDLSHHSIVSSESPFPSGRFPANRNATYSTKSISDPSLSFTASHSLSSAERHRTALTTIAPFAAKYYTRFRKTVFSSFLDPVALLMHSPALRLLNWTHPDY